MNLSKLKIGYSAKIIKVGGEGALRQHFLDMGLIQNAEVTVIKYAPMGDPIEIRIHGYELSIRLDDAKKIEVSEAYKTTNNSTNVLSTTHTLHPGLGEDGKYHNKHNKALEDNVTLTFALVGNQNCGKTTLFNQLTGSSQHVGNFPGVTVDRKDGVIKGHNNTLITDLPGIYSMSPYSSDELVTRSFLLDEHPKGIINIVDATNIERNLYLTMQLMELNIPMVIALNMMDEVRSNKGEVRVNELEAFLGVPVIPISASKNEGIEELVKHALHVAKYNEGPGIVDFCEKDDPVHRCIHGIMHLIEDHAIKANIPLRFAASKLAEGDHIVLNALNLSENEKEMLLHITTQMEEESGFDKSSAIANMRFTYIMNACKNSVVKPHESKERIRSRKMDKILTGKYTGIPAFILIMGLVFYLTFNVIGAFLSDLLEMGINELMIITDNLLKQMHVANALHSLIIDGIFNGVGSVLSFLPIIVTLFFFLSILEDSGYMARVAFIMDKLLRKVGLSGRSIVPMLIGFGCSVPGVMASRTLSSERDRKMTIMLMPFMSCSAKLPIYAFFSAAFFPDYAGLVMVFLYFLGILIGIISALVLKGTLFKGEAVPFVMELPNYRLPGAKNVAQLLWEKAKDFLQKAFTIIFVATIVIWALQSFDYSFNYITNSSESILANIAGFISPIFAPLGFNDYRISTALITGLMAKESVVSTLVVLLGNANIDSILSSASCLSLLVFCLLYTPCVAAIASVKRELGGFYSLAIVIAQCFIAWIVAFIIYNIIIIMI